MSSMYVLDFMIFVSIQQKKLWHKPFPKQKVGGFRYPAAIRESSPQEEK